MRCTLAGPWAPSPPADEQSQPAPSRARNRAVKLKTARWAPGVHQHTVTMRPLSFAAVAAVLGLYGCAANVSPQEPADPPADTEALGTPQFNALKSGKTAVQVTRIDLVSDQPGARNTDPTLVNAWGLAFSPSGTAWVSSNGNGLAELYDAQGRNVAMPVTIPGGSETAAPTGQVLNEDTAAFMGDRFIIATEGGTIAGWATGTGTSAETRFTSTRGAIYKGLTLSSFQGTRRLYAADFHNGSVDVFDAMYNPIKTSGGFRDVNLPKGFAPFNVVAAHGAIIVTYAMQDDMQKDDVKGAGNGYVNLFDADGNFLSRLASKGTLNSPWGVALAPWDLGSLSQRLLIGNFGDGRISVFAIGNDAGQPTAVAEGTLIERPGRPLVIDGLWALSFGPGAGGFDTHSLYFTAGPMDESHGLFGVLQLQTELHTFTK